MSDAYSREEQNTTLLQSLAAKSSTLRSLTDQMHGHSTASHGILDSTTESFSNMSTSLRGSAGRLTRSAQQGDRVAVLKIAAVVVVAVGALWLVGGWIFALIFGRR